MAKQQENSETNFWQTYTGKCVKGIVNGGGVVLSTPLNIVLQNIKVAKQNHPEKSIPTLVQDLYSKGGLGRFYNGFLPYATRVGLIYGGGGAVVQLCNDPIDRLELNPVLTGIFKIAAPTAFETIGTVGLEASELIKTKGLPSFKGTFFESLPYRAKMTWSIAPFAYLRNSFAWGAMLGTDMYSNHHDLSTEQRATLSMMNGFLAGILSTPFDRALTKAFGTEASVAEVFLNTIKNEGIKVAFAGAGARAAKIAVYTVAGSLMMGFMKNFEEGIVGKHTEAIVEQRRKQDSPELKK